MRRLLHIALLLALLVLPATAFAHGDAPLADQVHGVGESDWVLHTNFGVVTSAEPDVYVCEEAFVGGGRFQLAALELKRWLVFTRDAVLLTEDACDFEVVRTLPKNPAGVATSPDRGRVIYLMNDDDPEQDGLWLSDDGRSFSRPDLDLGGLDLTRAEFLDEERLVVSAYSTDEANSGAAHLLLVDLTDATATAIGDVSAYQRPYLLDAAGGHFVWLARDDGDYVVFWGTPHDPTLYSTAADRWPDGAALSEDGRVVWLAGATEGGRGVLEGRADTLPRFSERLADHSALCIGRVGPDHYLCARRDREGHDLSRIGEDDAVEPAVNFTELTGPRECPAGTDVADACPPVWPELAPALGIEVEEGGEDAGALDDAGVGQEGGGADGGCSVAGARARDNGWLFVIFVGMVGMRSRYRSRSAHSTDERP